MKNILLYIAVGLIILLFLRKFWMNQEAKKRIKSLDKEKLFLVDVREPDEFKSGSVAGAVNIPLGTISNRISEFKNKENIVVFCRSGNRSGMAANVLKQNGIENVTNGGTWQNVAESLK